jgi:hypothetical protein
MRRQHPVEPQCGGLGGVEVVGVLPVYEPADRDPVVIVALETDLPLLPGKGPEIAGRGSALARRGQPDLVSCSRNGGAWSRATHRR